VKNERRKLQLESVLLRTVQQRMAKGLADPRVRGLITITRVELTEDFKRAKAFVTVMPSEHAELTMHGLKAATPKIRKDIMGQIVIKDMPSLEFVYDTGLKAQMEVMALLVKDRLERGEAEPPAANDAVDQAQSPEAEAP
jgi:ribosome-binding factor A